MKRRFQFLKTGKNQQQTELETSFSGSFYPFTWMLNSLLSRKRSDHEFG